MIVDKQSFLRSNEGSMIIETAIVLPVLGILAFGGMEASMMAARSSELQSASAEAAAVVLAHRPRTADERDTIESIVEASTGLEDDSVTLTVKYRCETDDELLDSKTSCDPNKLISEFITVTIVDQYVPRWTGFGIGGPINYNYERRVQVG